MFLFILLLSISFQFRNWKKVVLLVTAFTIGHSLTLFMSSLDFISMNQQLIEILIALTILIAGILNIIT